MDGISSIGAIRAQQGVLTEMLKSGLKAVLRKESEISMGLSFISGDENLVLISEQAFCSLPPQFIRGARIVPIPTRLANTALPIDARRCIAYTTEEDINFIIEIAEALKENSQSLPSEMCASSHL